MSVTYPITCHTVKKTIPSICLSHQLSDHHTINMTSLSVCQSHISSVCHTTNMTSPSVCQTYNSSVCHTVILTSPSVCQLHDLSVCLPTHDVTITRNTVCKAVHPSSVLSVIPSAKFMVKMPMSIPVQKFPITQNPGKLPSTHTSMDSSADPSGSPSITLSPSAENPSKIPCKNGDNDAVNYLHKIPVKSPTVCTSYGTSHLCIIRSIHTYIMHYICHCTHPCIVHTIHPYIMHYICHCTCPCIIHPICQYIIHYVCHCTHLCIIHSVHPSN